MTDLGPLRHCTRLTALDISFCDSISDLAPLKDAKHLETLHMNWARGVRDLGPLRGCASLRSLSMQWCDIEDLTPLHELQQASEPGVVVVT